MEDEDYFGWKGGVSGDSRLPTQVHASGCISGVAGEEGLGVGVTASIGGYQIECGREGFLECHRRGSGVVTAGDVAGSQNKSTSGVGSLTGDGGPAAGLLLELELGRVSCGFRGLRVVETHGFVVGQEVDLVLQCRKPGGLD